MDISAYCLRCGKKLSDMDRLSGYCSTCGEPLPVLAEDAQPAADEEEAPEEAIPSEQPQILEWKLSEDGLVSCPVCEAIYDADDLPEKCERCADDPQYAGAVWVLPDAERSLPWHLVWLRTSEQVLLRDGLVLGREDLPFLESDRYISRRHAAVRIENSQVFIRDLGSVNGTFVNGERLQAGEERLLSDGDTVTLDLQQFRFESGTPGIPS